MSELQWHFEPARIEQALAQLLPAPRGEEAGLAQLRNAMRHGVFGGGKRMRSQLVLECAAVAAPRFDAAALFEKCWRAACAFELIHAYSLIHDDLPSMDDAATRRNRPCCHIIFGEALTILAGDALQTLAFQIMTETPGDPATTLQAIALLARASGEKGMVGGQSLDLAWTAYEGHSSISVGQLSHLQELKTGALICAAAQCGALLGGGDEAAVQALRLYGDKLGRAFQIWDDVLDVVGDPEITGKSSTDAANDKMTFPSVHGLDKARELACQESQDALVALQPFDARANHLRALARYVVERNK
jgi:geranylgeranyl pyrophosphate synthase